MDFNFDTILQILNGTTPLILAILQYNLWDNNIPKTIEEFNAKYEKKINNILKDNLFESSNILDSIISNKIDSNSTLSENKEKSAEYTALIKKQEYFLIKIKKHIEIENRIKNIEKTYYNLNNINKKTYNLCLVIIFLSISILILLGNAFNHYVLWLVCSLNIGFIFRFVIRYFESQVLIKNLITHKDWILETTKSIKRLSDDDEN